MQKFIDNFLFGLAFGLGWVVVGFVVWLILMAFGHGANAPGPNMWNVPPVR